jgi:hypothetical protein
MIIHLNSMFFPWYVVAYLRKEYAIEFRPFQLYLLPCEHMLPALYYLYWCTLLIFLSRLGWHNWDPNWLLSRLIVVKFRCWVSLVVTTCGFIFEIPIGFYLGWSICWMLAWMGWVFWIERCEFLVALPSMFTWLDQYQPWIIILFDMSKTCSLSSYLIRGVLLFAMLCMIWKVSLGPGPCM